MSASRGTRTILGVDGRLWCGWQLNTSLFKRVFVPGGRKFETKVVETRHARLPVAIADLEAGFEIFLEFAGDIGAIGKVERDELAQRACRRWTR